VEQGRFRYRVAAVPASRSDDEDHGTAGAGPAHPGEDGWELIRSRQTKDGVSMLFLYRRPA
jgi:hypothetical protein